MYAAAVDPYCYPGSTVLRNRPGLTDQAALDRFEVIATANRFLEPMPVGRFGERHFRAVHRHIFQDVYAWAGRSRTVRIGKGGSTFCYPEHIDAELRRIFTRLRQAVHLRGLDRARFAIAAAHVLAELNAVHAFRDGNGRAQLAFMALLADQAGHPLDLVRIDPSTFLAAMIASFRGDERPLAGRLLDLIA